MTVEVKSRNNIGNLRVYQLARDLEEQAFTLTVKLLEKEKYMLADHLRRSATACAHFIAEAHGHYSYTDKVKTL